jgi:hypothetical protein
MGSNNQIAFGVSLQFDNMYKVFYNNNNNKWDYLLNYSDLSCQMVIFSSLFLHKKKS